MANFACIQHRNTCMLRMVVAFTCFAPLPSNLEFGIKLLWRFPKSTETYCFSWWKRRFCSGYISVTCRQGRQVRQCLPYHNLEMFKKNWGYRITNGVNICPFIVKRCNYSVILIVFTVNSLWIFVFLLQVRRNSRREATTACASSRLAGWISLWAVCHQTELVSSCRAIHLSVTFMSSTVQCCYTLLIYVLAFYTLEVT